MKQTLSNPSSPSSSASRLSPYSIKSPTKQIPLITKLERLLEQAQHICWSECGQNIVVNGIRTIDFTQELGGIGLSNKPESFIRQLNTYGFRKLQEPLDASLMHKLNYSVDQVSVYHNQYFTRHHKDISEIHAIGKRKPVNNDREELHKAQERIKKLEEDNQKLATFIHSYYVINPNQANAVQQLDATNLLLGLKHTRVAGLNSPPVNIPISVPLNIVNIQANQLAGLTHLPQQIQQSMPQQIQQSFPVTATLPCLAATSTNPVVSSATSLNNSMTNGSSQIAIDQLQLLKLQQMSEHELQQLLLKHQSGCDINMNKNQ